MTAQSHFLSSSIISTFGPLHHRATGLAAQFPCGRLATDSNIFLEMGAIMTTHNIQARLGACALAASMLCASLPAAADNAILLSGDIAEVTNPFTNQVTDVWKLLGISTNNCWGVQVSPYWVLASAHCGNASVDTNNNFKNFYGSALIEPGSCKVVPSHRPDTLVNDLSMCRLSSPLMGASTYPKLVKGFSIDRLNANKMGSLMGFGRTKSGVAPLTLGFYGFNGLPYGYEPALSAQPAPIQNGDGGSSTGVFWYSPGSNTPAVVGVISKPNGSTWGDNDSPSRVAWYITNQNADELNAIIRSNNIANGHTDPDLVFITPAQYFTAPAGDLPPELSTPPKASWFGNGSVKLKWAGVSSTSGLNGYKVSSGHDKDPQSLRVQNVSDSTLEATLSNVPGSADSMACVQPFNNVGHANAAWVPFNKDIAVETPNCVAMDTRQPLVIQGLTLSTSPAGSFTKVMATWAAQSLPTSSYRIDIVTAYNSGPTRKSTQYQLASQPNWATTVVKGTKVCMTISGLTAIQRPGSGSTSCIVAP
jgi:Trypsin